MFFNKLVLEKKDYIERYIQSADDLRMTLKDGTYYVWVKPVDNSRGHRCSKAYIDKNLTLNELDKVIPICILCSKNDIEII
jgi:hypothetical protein